MGTKEQPNNRTIRTLLHACCGPCASACVPRLKELGREVTMLFANSNIDTREEFEKRLHEAEKLAKVDGVKIVTLPYDHDEWLREVAAGYEHEPEKGARCARCFRYNLSKTAAYAAAHGFDEFSTSLTVSPHKVSRMIFAAASSLIPRPSSLIPSFLPEDFKKREGFKFSVRRAKELNLYRQAYCGCEFSKAAAARRQLAGPAWSVHHKAETVSTNLEARIGGHGDVFTADFQSAGRGRLDHKWLSQPGTNLMMSVVLSVEGMAPEQVATLPLVVGLAVARAVNGHNARSALKWPNDVLVGGKKIAGILCERHGDNVIAGIGVNVNQTAFPPEIADRATSLRLLIEQSEQSNNRTIPVTQVRDSVLSSLGRYYALWREKGFAVVYPEIAEIDSLRGRVLSVRQTDDDSAPATGVSNGIMSDGSLDVGGVKVYAGEAHVEKL